MNIRAIVTDIEGTTSSISFVHDVLFPYAKDRLADFVIDHKSQEEVESILRKALKEALDRGDISQEELETEDAYVDIHSSHNTKLIIDTMVKWIEQDQKIGPLKELQGLIWEAGYKQGDFKGHLYKDAFKKLEEWHKAKLPIYIYSSGSVKAQKLLFGYSEFGDINHLFTGNFDIKVGGKKEAHSYTKIHESLQEDLGQDLKTEEILFLSDVEAELDAAKEAGMQTIQLVRKGTEASLNHETATDFNSVMALGQAL